MRCEDATRELSAAADGRQVGAGLDAHLHVCPSCRQFATDVETIRRLLRDEGPGEAPDVSARVVAALADEKAAPVRPHPLTALTRIAAVTLAGVLLGSALTAIAMRPEPAGAMPLGEQVLAAQHDVDSLSASVTILERGWSAQVPGRRLTGALVYRAPDHIALSVRDRTTYPAGWQPNDIDVVVAGSEWWTRGLRDCPRPPQCTPAAPRVRAVTGSEPFADNAPNPLELIVPVRSFALSAPTTVRQQRIQGLPAVGVSISAAQVQPLLDAVHLAGNLRQVHPADPVDLWLARDVLTPLRLTVAAAEGEARRRWARARGYADRAGDEILTLALTDVAVNKPIADGAFAPPPPDARRVDLGYRAETAAAFGPDRLGGLLRRLSGRTEVPGGTPTTITAWTGGRVWLVARRTTAWGGGRLFGELGPDVAVVALGAGGVGYMTPEGDRLAIHSDAVDLVIYGSVSGRDLQRAAGLLGVKGVRVPNDWEENSTITPDQAKAVVHRLLVAPRLSGFAPPTYRRDRDGVVMTFAGAGARAFTLAQGDSNLLPPPTDPDAAATAVRGHTGRYSPATGTLEWIENGRRCVLQSTALGPGELVAIAARLRR